MFIVNGVSGALLHCINFRVATDPACGSGGMFVQTGDFVEHAGMQANNTMTFYGQEKVEYNAQLCLMNLAVHGLTGVVKSGDEANTFYHDAHNLAGCCDYVMANPPFNVDKVKSESAQSAGRLPFGIPSVNKNKEFGNANYLWISYFYAYLNEHGRAGFVMASSATDSQGKDKDIREKLVRTGHVDVMVSVGNNFFYTRSLPCSLWFFDKGKKEELRDKVLFIDARNYYTVVDRTLNEWNEWQIRNLTAIVWLYRGEASKYTMLLDEYGHMLNHYVYRIKNSTIFEYMEYLLRNTHWPTGQKEKQKQYLDLCDELKEKIASLHWYAAINDYKKIEDLQLITQLVDKFETQSLAALRYNNFKEIIYHYRFDDEIEIPKCNLSDTRVLKKSSFVAQIKNTCLVIRRELDAMIEASKGYFWLTQKFGKGEYSDIPGLCKVATLAEIEAKGYSLTPGAYVGVAPAEDDGVDFHERMTEIHKELLSLQEESNRLMETISKNWEEMGL